MLKILISKYFRKYDYRNIIGKRLMIQLEALVFNLIKELISAKPLLDA
jgi:hypothetical protein